MHVDAEAVRKSVRTYFMIGGALLVFTAITVAANLLHLSVPAAITLALIIASIKASMVAAAMTALMPGAGPPPTRIASVFISLGSLSEKPS